MEHDLAEALEIIESMLDDDPCRYDHHGECQTHGFHDLDGGVCTMVRMRALVAKHKTI